MRLSYRDRLLIKDANGLRGVISFDDFVWLDKFLKDGEPIRLTPECYDEVAKLYEPADNINSEDV